MKYYFFGFLFFFIHLVNAQENQKYININGTSELNVLADQLKIVVQINTIDKSVEESKKNNDKYLNELLTILKNNKIDTNDIEVSPITLGKHYEYSEKERKQNGYYAYLTVSFLLKDLSRYYELTNKLATSNNFEIQRSDYSISDYEQKNKLAYEKALKAAIEKAEYMTKTLGVKLGEVLEIDENNRWQTYPNPTNSITTENTQRGFAGKVTIRRSVRVKFAIK